MYETRDAMGLRPCIINYLSVIVFKPELTELNIFWVKTRLAGTFEQWTFPNWNDIDCFLEASWIQK